MKTQRSLYLFVDESGNFDFSEKGTRFFTLTCITTERPFEIYQYLDDYKYNLIETGFPREHFHCSQDNKHIRSKIFCIIQNYIEQLRIDSIVVEKRKTHPSLQEPSKFYSRMLGYLLGYVLKGYKGTQFSKIIIVTDNMPITKKRNETKKAIKIILQKMLPINSRYEIVHHTAKSHYGLQVADYCSWGVFIKWEKDEHKYYQRIKPALMSELNIFQTGTVRYY